MSEIEEKINNISLAISEVKVTVATLNGKVDALTGLIGTKGENVQERFKFVEKHTEQGFKAVVERINFEVQRSEEAHKDIRDDIVELKQKEIDPIKMEVEHSKIFRNKVIGMAIGISAIMGGAAGVLAKFFELGEP